MKMKLSILISLIFISSGLFGQFQIDAGHDTAYCVGIDKIYLGGFLTATGGNEPYSYSWSCIGKEYFGNPLVASFILNDTSIANPFLKNIGSLNDTILFNLTVQDNNLNIKKDSVRIILSSIQRIHMIFFGPTINQGDSIQIYPINVYNGIAPFKYEWSPISGLSNPLIEKPYAKPDTSTKYTVQVTDAIGCTTWDEVYVFVKLLSSLDIQSFNDVEFRSKVYPNPIDINSLIYFDASKKMNLSIRVININGQTILDDKMMYEYYKIGEKIAESGLYLYLILEDNQIISHGQFVKK